MTAHPLKTSGKKCHGIPFSPSAQTARLLVMCSECLKPRVIYSKQKLTIWEEHALERTLDNILFTCGSSLTGLEIEKLRSDPPSVQTVLGRVFVRENLSCDDCIEIPYYSSEKFQDNICIHCAFNPSGSPLRRSCLRCTFCAGAVPLLDGFALVTVPICLVSHHLVVESAIPAVLG